MNCPNTNAAATRFPRSISFSENLDRNSGLIFILATNQAYHYLALSVFGEEEFEHYEKSEKEKKEKDVSKMEKAEKKIWGNEQSDK